MLGFWRLVAVQGSGNSGFNLYGQGFRVLSSGVWGLEIQVSTPQTSLEESLEESFNRCPPEPTVWEST